MINPLRLAFSRDEAPALAPAVARQIEDAFAVAEPESLLARSIRLNDKSIAALEGAAGRLENEIADLTEQLRQTRVVIEGRKANASILHAGTRQQAAE